MAGPFGHARAGKGSRVQANGVNMMQTDWRAIWRGDDLDTSNFEAQGFEQGMIGFQVIEFNSNGWWNAAVNPLDAPPGIFPQDLFPNQFFFTSTGDGSFWFLPFSRILSCENGGVNAKGLVPFAWSGKSNGSFSVPTGSN
jgi:hypothetical protein